MATKIEMFTMTILGMCSRECGKEVLTYAESNLARPHDLQGNLIHSAYQYRQPQCSGSGEPIMQVTEESNGMHVVEM
jgi:hypothetical protein